VVEELLEVVRLVFSDLAAVSDSDLFEAEVLFSADCLELLDVSEPVLEALWVELLADAGPDVVAVLLAVPLLDVAVVPLEELLVFVEAELFEELPPVDDCELFAVEPELLVSLLVLPLVADALSVSEADFTLLAVSEWFDDAASVAANDLLELVVKLSVLVSLLLFEWLKEALRVLEELLVSVEFDEWVASSWLFAPRL
jgi:hypothetical protein